MSFLITKAAINSLDKHSCCPWTRVRTPPSVVIESGLRGLHLLQGHTLLDHILDAVLDDGNHVPLVGNVANVTEPAVARNDHGSALRSELGISDVENFVQRVELALNAAASFQVDYRIA